MAQFRGTLLGSRGMVSRLGTKQSGLVVEANGWYTGCRVEVRHDEDQMKDRVSVYRTAGSNRGKEELVATWYDNAPTLHVKGEGST